MKILARVPDDTACILASPERNGSPCGSVSWLLPFLRPLEPVDRLPAIGNKKRLALEKASMTVEGLQTHSRLMGQVGFRLPERWFDILIHRIFQQDRLDASPRGRATLGDWRGRCPPNCPHEFLLPHASLPPQLNNLETSITEHAYQVIADSAF